MLNDRLNASRQIANDFRQAEEAADRAAALTAACMATMLKERAAANLPLGVGLDALQLVTNAAAGLVRARQDMIEAHRALVSARDDIGLRAYGDTSECPPTDSPRAFASGSVGLAAVA
jgi:hypothetical protein